MTQQSDETVKQLTGILNGMLTNAEQHAQQIRSDVQHFQEVWLGMETTPPARVLFCSPVTGLIQPGDNVWGGGWFVTTKYLDYYTASGAPAYHPGVDLNLPNYADSGKPVFAAADGEVVVSRAVPGWPGQMVVIKHTLENGELIFTRYAHLKEVTPIGMVRVFVKRGDVIGKIGDYAPAGPANDHLDYSISHKDLGAHPEDWPGMDKARVITDYVDPAVWTKDRSV